MSFTVQSLDRKRIKTDTADYCRRRKPIRRQVKRREFTRRLRLTCHSHLRLCPPPISQYGGSAANAMLINTDITPIFPLRAALHLPATYAAPPPVGSLHTRKYVLPCRNPSCGKTENTAFHTLLLININPTTLFYHCFLVLLRHITQK